MRFIEDGINEVYVYEYEGSPVDSNVEPYWTCDLGQNRQREWSKVQSNLRYDTVRSNSASLACAYEVAIFSPEGTGFQYDLYTDGGRFLGLVFGWMLVYISL